MPEFPLGGRLDETSPMVDARLPDGSRLNAVIPPLAKPAVTPASAIRCPRRAATASEVPPAPV